MPPTMDFLLIFKNTYKIENITLDDKTDGRIVNLSNIDKSLLIQNVTITINNENYEKYIEGNDTILLYNEILEYKGNIYLSFKFKPSEEEFHFERINLELFEKIKKELNKRVDTKIRMENAEEIKDKNIKESVELKYSKNKDTKNDMCQTMEWRR